MSFLNPLALSMSALAGAIVVMYLLKLRRRRHDISSTLLWMKSVQDLTANAPFQKLRQNLLMYLQILFLLLLAFALANPMMWLNSRTGQSRILLIDNTASMNAADGSPGGSRLEAAKATARDLVNNMKSDDQMMIVSLGGEARVEQGFTSQKGLLDHAIANLAATDAPARTREAFLLAQGVRKLQKDAVITLVSDGGVGFLGNMVTEGDTVQFYPIGRDDRNAGIVSFDIRESFEQRGEFQAFAEIENYDDAQAHLTVRCSIDGEVVQVREEDLAGKAKQGFAFTGLNAGTDKLLTIEIIEKDLLDADNVVHGILNLKSALRILLVSHGNFFLERMLTLLPGAEVSIVKPQAFNPTEGYDITVFDQFSPPELGSGYYLFINALPPFEGFEKEAEPAKDQIALDWNRIHPVTRFVSLDSLFAAEALHYTAPDWMTTLVEASECDLIAAGQLQGTKIIVVGFDIYKTDWPLQVSFPVFLANATSWLSATGEAGAKAVHYTTGSTVTIESAAPMEIESPDGERWTLEPDSTGLAYFNHTLMAGLYTMTSEGGGPRRFAVNLLSPQESDLTPTDVITSGEQKIVAASLTRENRPVWTWFVIGAILLLAGEWHLYCRRSWL